MRKDQQKEVEKLERIKRIKLNDLRKRLIANTAKFELCSEVK